MGGELTEGVGEQKPALHDQNTTSNPALKTTSTQAFQEISSPFGIGPKIQYTCRPNRMAAVSPTQLWRVYMLGLGGVTRLWLSNTA